MTNVPTEEPFQDSDDAASPHDGLFYKTFSKPEHAAAELKCIFSSALVALIAWGTLTPLPLKFVDAKLVSRYSDVLYSVEIGGRECLIYILFEHKSDDPYWTLLQLAEYKTRIWRAYLDDEKNRGKKHLPIILPVVLHHSERGWRCPTRFRQYFDVPENVAAMLDPYILNFGVLLDDISHVNAETIARRPITHEGRLVLFALRFGRTPARLLEELPKIAPELAALLMQPHGDLVIAAFVVYLKTVGKLPEAEVRVALQQTLGNTLAEQIMYAGERRYAQGLHDGELRGELRGELKGELKAARNLLKRQLVQRFGRLPPEVIARIDAATQIQLDAMVPRVITAATLEEALD